MDRTMRGGDRVQINTDLIPESQCIEICEAVFKGVKEFFANMTPEQKADFESWNAEYERREAERRRAPKGGTA